MATITTDRSTQLNAFEETKTGVKGLVDSGITEVPAIFRAPMVVLDNLKPPPASQLTIPTVDLKEGGVFLKNQEGSVTRRGMVEKIGDGAKKWGFFQVVNHGIPIDKMDKMREGIRGFHEQDTESKKRFYSRDHTRKWVCYSNVDLYTARAASWRDTLLLLYDPRSSHTGRLACGELLFELLSEALGLKPNHLKDMGCTESLVMFCQEIYIGGLQVLHDQYWVDVPPVPGAFVVNIGDLLQLISNDKFISVEHRVVANGAAEPRISVPCFLSSIMKANPRVYGPIKELLSEQNPPKYRELTISEFSNMFGTKELNTSALHHFKI
uniref:Fe2OG dioxygenase domain-containing protein n=1 Tax=Brassica oleracea var. oleracea TaxID=109376 RepID=A0A0D3DUU6_BRAOL